MTKNRDSDAIAIVGMSALFPGSIGSQSFWQNIVAGRDFMTDIPEDHWLIDDYFDPDPAKPGKIYAKRGAFLPAVDFDPLEYGLPPRQLSTTDTAQLLALIVAQKVLDDAVSMQFGKVDKRDVSVILGVASATELVGQMAARIQRPNWIKGLRDAGLAEDQVQAACDRIEATYPTWDESTFPGLLGNVVAGRITNRLDLGGTNCVVDAACASSLGAVAMAVQELQLGHSDLVITGGVDALNDIFMFMCFSKTPALSPTGDCRPFAESADGTMLGEGIGMVALRRLADAERDGDRIYAVLRGIGSSSDGRAKSIYAPRSEGQEVAIRRAYKGLDYDQSDVGLIEAHGTATKAGDLAEFEGLRRAFSEVPGRQICALGSVKSQIGHTKSAAGSASLFKTAMALHHKVLPPTIKVDRPSAKLDIANSPFYLNTRTRPWIAPAGGAPRRASVSSFGFGGSNFHIALEEYRGGGGTRVSTLPVNMLLVASDSAEGLISRMRELREALASRAPAALARASQIDFDARARHRIAILGGDADGLSANLASAIELIGKAPETPASLPNRLHYGVGGDRPKLAFLFPGQGSQYVEMGADLAVEFEAARRVWDEAADVRLADDRALHEVVFPVPVFEESERQAQSEQLMRTEWAQPAIGMTSLSMLRLLEQLGLTPDAVAGHSYGEVTALHAAGVLPDLVDLLAVSRKRGELMAEAAGGDGAMLAIRASAETVERLIAAHAAGGMTLANRNGPSQTVVAGSNADIAAFEPIAVGAGLACRRLMVATAFHSPIVAGSVAPFEDFLAGVTMAAPLVPIYGNAEAAPYPADPAAIRAALARQLASPVRFAEMIDRLHADGVRLFLEVGPGNSLRGLVGDCLAGREHRAIALDNRKLDGRAALFDALAQISSAGILLDYAALWQSFAPSEGSVEPAKRSAATVKLTGANHGKPYPPAGGAAARTPPNPVKPAAPVAQVTVAAVPHVPAAMPALSTPSSATAPAAAQPKDFAMPSHPPIAPAETPDAAWSAFETMQANMLEAQKAFTQAMSDSHLAYLRASEVSMLQLGGGLAASVGAAPSSASLPGAALPAARQVAAEPFSSFDPTIVPAAAPAAPPAVVRTSAPAAPARQERPKTQAPSAGDPTALLLEVVSDKTGYPVEMLTLDMELEAGLGVDSIKRVQILSALQEKLPQLADVDTNALAALNTLGEIVALASAIDAQAPNVAVTADIDATAMLLEVVSEKTGYPVEMLTLDMELEAGLGIDSIKRVQILSALQERLPQLADVDTNALAALNTLGEIVALAGAVAGPVPDAASGVANVDVTALLLEVVAEKTGYPVEMLTLDMELEAGLGIDSIKRVQILSALQEKLPQLADVDTNALAALNTLGEIVALAGAFDETAGATIQEVGAEVDATALLLEVVAEKTGYPVEMLTLDMELEAGLGIDSIKRVQILSALQEKLPQLADVDTNALAALNTLGEIVALASASGSGSGPVGALPNSAKAAATALERVVVGLGDSPLPGLLTPALFDTNPLWIAGTPTALADALARDLERLGIAVRRADALPADARACILLQADPEESGSDPSQLSETVFAAIKPCAATMAKEGRLLVVVQATGGDFAIGADAGERAWAAGIGAIAKTAALEWPHVTVRSIDIELGDRSVDQLAQAVRNELIGGGTQLEAGLKADGRRVAPRLEASQPAGGIEPAVGEGVLIVSGGARGVTAECLAALLGERVRPIAIFGRTPLPEEQADLDGLFDEAALKRALLARHTAAGTTLTPIELGAEVRAVIAGRELKANLARFAALGAAVRYEAVDIGDAAAVGAAVSAIRRDMGPIGGIVHAAGVLADKEIRQKTIEQFRSVLHTKVVGLKNLLAATRGDKLDRIVCFSSIAAWRGNVGQCDYAAANQILNRVCRREHRRRGDQCLVKAIGWGPWAGGMVDAGLEAHFAGLGVALIPLAEGARFFVDEYFGRHGDEVEVIFGGGLDAFAAAGERAPEARFHARFHRETHGYIGSHVIRANNVVPLVAAVDLARRTVSQWLGGVTVGRAEHVEVVGGMSLPAFDGSGDVFDIACSGPDDAGRVAVQISDAAGRLCYRMAVLPGEAELSDNAGGALVAAGAVANWPVDKPIYDGRLFHGPDLQVLETVEALSADGATGLLRSQGADLPAGGAPIDILDGGLQLSVLWGHERRGRESLPTGVRAIHLTEGWEDSPAVRCEAQCNSSSELATDWTLRFRDPSGKLLGLMEGVTLHDLPTGTN